MRWLGDQMLGMVVLAVLAGLVVLIATCWGSGSYEAVLCLDRSPAGSVC